MLRKLLDRLHPSFDKGGKLEKLYPLYEALDTFLYSPGDTTLTASHVRDGMNLKRMMSLVVLALGPCIFMALYNTGYQANYAVAKGLGEQLDTWREPVLESLGLGHDHTSHLDNLILGALYFLPVYIVTMTVGGLWEVLFAMVRGHEVNEGFLVTGMLFPLTLPPTIPLWQVAIGISFGVVIGKEIFGGTGKNFLNPALTARAFLYFAYASEISSETNRWGEGVWAAADGISSPTPLGAMAAATNPTTASVPTLTELSWMDCFIGFTQGSMGETSTLAALIGAAVLIALGVGSWRIMAGCVVGLFAMASVLYVSRGASDNAMMYLGPHWHLVIGGFAFGAVFMATDPVSAAMTDTGRWIYGVLIGVMTVLVRTINPAFPEGIMLAILFGNVMAPLIDYFVIQANIKRRLARYEA